MSNIPNKFTFYHKGTKYHAKEWSNPPEWVGNGRFYRITGPDFELDKVSYAQQMDLILKEIKESLNG